MLHSKLKTKIFPKVDNVLDKIASMMPLFNLNIILYDQEDYQELEKMNGIEVNIYLSNSNIIKKLSESVREQVNNFVKPQRRLELIQRLKILQDNNMFNTNFGNNSNNRLYTLNNFGNHRRSIKSSLLRSKNKNNKNKTNTEHLSSNNNSDISNDSREQNIQEYKQLKKQINLLIDLQWWIIILMRMKVEKILWD